MDEYLLANYYQDLCDQLLAIRKSGLWKETHDSFDEYVVARWSISKTRAKLLCNFAKFRAMCREGALESPETPENVKAVLALPQKMWLDVWRLVVDCQSDSYGINDAHCKAVLERFGIYANKKLPADVLERMRLKRATKTLAEFGDGEALIERIGSKTVGKHFDPAVTVLIDADMARRSGVE